MFLPGEIVEVKDWNQATRKMEWGRGLSFMARVVHSRYEGGDRLREFVGVAIDGNFEGMQLAIQNGHARYPRKVGE